MSEWIMVSDEVPDECGKGLLLTVKNKHGQKRVIAGFTGYMESGKLEFYTNDRSYNLKMWEVVAWQPLPEAFDETKDKVAWEFRGRSDFIDNLKQANAHLMIINEDIKYPKLSKEHKEWLWASQIMTQNILANFIKEDIESLNNRERKLNNEQGI